MTDFPFFTGSKSQISPACHLAEPGIRILDFGFRQLRTLLLGVLLISTACAPKETRLLSKQSDALGIVLAEEAIRAAGPRKQIVIISPDASWGPASGIEETFEAACTKQGLPAVITTKANVGDPMRMGGLGLKPGDFLGVLQKYPDAGAIVSFAGAPLLNPDDTARLGPNHPPVLVVATTLLGTGPGLPGDRTQLARLLDARLIQLAIIDGSDPAVSSATGSDATHKLFAEHYRIVRGRD